MADKAALIRNRGHIKAKFTIFDKYIRDWTSQIGIRALEARLKGIEENFQTFNIVQNQITLLDDSEAQRNEGEKIEKIYYELVERAYQLLDSNRVEQLQSPLSPTYVQASPDIKLPKIELVKFSGDYKQWVNFSEIFKSLVIKNSTLTEVQKLYYLKAVVVGEAASLINSLELSEVNFQVAWKLLEDRYQNRKITINILIREMFNFPTLNKESAASLRNLLDIFQRNVGALTAMKEPTEYWDTLLVYLMVTKLDVQTRVLWEQENTIDKSPKFKDIVLFLVNRCHSLESIATDTSSRFDGKATSSSRPKTDKGFKYFKNKSTVSKQTFVVTEVVCSFCKDKHQLFSCEKFRTLEVVDRIQHVKDANLCMNCLKVSHFVRNCKNTSSCKTCGRKHNTLLHKPITFNKVVGNTQQNQTLKNGQQCTINTSNVNIVTKSKHKEILLSTALVTVLDKNNAMVTARCLLDCGSQSNFITQALCDKLGLPKKQVSVPVLTLNGNLSNISYQMKIQMKDIGGRNPRRDLTCLVVDKISRNIPTAQIDTSSFPMMDDIRLADPGYDIPAPVDILIGSEEFWQIILPGSISLGENNPILKASTLGWICTGSAMTYMPPVETVCQLNVVDILKSQLDRFFKLEEIVVNPVESSENYECEKLFTNTTTRDQDGRYIVSLPRKQTKVLLGDSKAIAYKRLYMLESKLDKVPEQKQQYISFMREYEKLGHMTELSFEEDRQAEESYYIPHFPVIREDSTSTPLRVVFDASQNTTSGISLNDTLMTGPQIQNNLMSILLRFRLHNYVIAGDIHKFFRQVKVMEEQRCLQKICWRENKMQTVKIFQLNTVTYGMTSSPYLASRSLKQLMIDEGHNYPLAASTHNSWYCDDYLGGHDDLQMATELRSQISQLLLLGGFKICKWISNNTQILETIPETDRAKDASLQFDQDYSTKALGLVWFPAKDQFTYTVSEDVQADTKRTILSEIAKLFDPLGLIQPILTNAKLIMQHIWQCKLGWDDPVSFTIQQEWNRFRRSLHFLRQLQIPRSLKLSLPVVNVQLHIFSDASTIAYGACAYLRCEYSTTETSTRLIMSKGKIAPLKFVSLPRLELSAALLAVKLANFIIDSLQCDIDSIHYWVDSTIVLNWLEKDIDKVEVFVKNRVSKILEETVVSQWNHVNTKQNPADIITRGSKPQTLLTSQFWFEGPMWLKLDHINWPSQSHNCEYDQEKLSLNLIVCKVTMISQLWDKFSSMNRLTRVIAYCRRFISNCKLDIHQRQSGALNVGELNSAWNSIIRDVQKETFPEERKALQHNIELPHASKLKQLNPFLDEEGIIRVGGRLQHASISEEAKHPAILPSRHKVTSLIIQQYHLRNLHAAPQLLLAILREKVWILQARRSIRSVLHKCMICYRVKPRLASQLMGQLPKERLTPSRPFAVTGLDLCGPIYVKEGTKRKYIQVKAYLAIFICMASKAVHIEVVQDASTEAFIRAFRRFISRRGRCHTIFSDCGSNFIGANRRFKELRETFTNQHNRDTIVAAAADEHIIWKFNVPMAPHQGGIWEAAVKQAKYHLRRMIGQSLYTYEELNTFAIQVEACLNSRPLTQLSEDPSDLQILTPAHLLIGESLKAIPEPSYIHIPQNRLKNWQNIQKLMQTFWKRWSREYLLQLQNRKKWFSKENNLQIGQLVLISDKNAPPLSWKRGRVSRIIKGPDNLVRSAVVKTQTSELTRSIHQLAPLPIEEG